MFAEAPALGFILTVSSCILRRVSPQSYEIQLLQPCQVTGHHPKNLLEPLLQLVGADLAVAVAKPVQDKP